MLCSSSTSNHYSFHSFFSIRGMLGSLLTLTANAGMVFGFVIGTYLEYYMQMKILILLPIAFLVAFNYFPETPDFLLQQQKKIVSKLMHFNAEFENNVQISILDGRKIDEFLPRCQICANLE